MTNRINYIKDFHNLIHVVYIKKYLNLKKHYIIFREFQFLMSMIFFSSDFLIHLENIYDCI